MFDFTLLCIAERMAIIDAMKYCMCKLNLNIYSEYLDNKF